MQQAPLIAMDKRQNDKKSSCPFCPDTLGEILVRGLDLSAKCDLLRCPLCSLVFFARTYSATDYWVGAQPFVYNDERVKIRCQQSARERAAWLRQRVQQGNRLLDVGCGTGAFLAAAREYGFDAIGIDSSPVSAQMAAESAGYERVLCGTLTSQKLNGPFDVITMWDVIEHIPQPVAELTAARDLLSPQGLLILLTPNQDAFFRHVALAIYRISGGMIRSPLSQLYYLGHYCVYSEKTMRVVMPRLGFACVEFLRQETDVIFARKSLEKDKCTPLWVRLAARGLPFLYWLSRRLGQKNKLLAVCEKTGAVPQ